jgi:H+-transporting ATPase
VSPEKPKELSVDEKSRGAYAKTGLSSEEVERKRQQYGSNEIPEKKVNPVRKFLGYFWGPIPWMIETAAVFIHNYSALGRLCHNLYVVNS